MKLCIQIPCLNEEQTLLETLKAIPQTIEGVRQIEVIVIDDGSDDQTYQIARDAGVKHVVKIKLNRGLANAFKVGIKKSLSLGADVIVNLDADHQYPAQQISSLIRPILEGRADIVLGARDFESIKEFSKIKVFFQRMGSWVLSQICRVRIPDAATGFRAFSRPAAARLNVFTKYTYTLETLIQAAQAGEKIISIPVATQPVKRPSRLFSHPSIYVLRSCGAIIRLVLLYNPLRVMSSLSFAVVLWAGWVYWTSHLSPHRVEYFVYECFLVLLAAILFMVGLVLDQIAVNRRLLEQVLERTMDGDRDES